MAAASRKLTFAGSHGTTLAARLELPAGKPKAYALFAHCFTCGKDAHAATRISRALAEEGIAVLRFDFTGLGSSEGDFGATDFSSNTDDLVCAADHLREHYAAPSILIGHSLGGAAVLATVHRIPEVTAVATVGAPADPSHVAHLLGDARETIEATGKADVTLAGRTFCIEKKFLDDIAAQPQRERINKLGAALLVLHSPTDELVSVDNAREIFDAARHPRSFVALDGADHLLTKRADAEYVAKVLAAWAGRYAFEAEGEANMDAPAEGLVEVSETRAGRFTQQIVAGHHVLTADEPRPIGDDTGPSPYDMLLAALGACTTMTVRMYAERKGWALDQATVTLRHAHIHAEDCADCETKEGKIDRIERQLYFEGDLDDDQQQRLLEIADKCPIHNTLRSETVIATTLG